MLEGNLKNSAIQKVLTLLILAFLQLKISKLKKEKTVNSATKLIHRISFY